MEKKNIIRLYYYKENFFSITFFCCKDFIASGNDEGFITSSITEDYSSITNPRERWNAYKLSSYAIDQSWACECFPPNLCNSYIINNSVTDVKYEISKNSYYGRSEEEIYDYTKNKAVTVNQAFDIIDKYKTDAYSINVVYDPSFGFPTKIFIDIDSMIVDEEIIRGFSNLKKIN